MKQVSIFLGMAIALAAASASACTGFYAGKKTTVDGTVLIGRTVDVRPINACFRLAIVPKGEADPLDGKDAPPAKYRFVCTPSLTSGGRGTFHSAAANERGLVVSGTVTGHSRAEIGKLDPCTHEEGDNWVGEHNLTGILAGQAATAREGVKVLGEAIACRKHTGQEIYMLADRNEAWYVEVYSTHQWAAVRMPEDKVACFGNQFMLRDFDPDSPDSMHSPELVTMAERAGILVRGADGKIDLCRTYSQPLSDYANLRTWYGLKVLAPSTAGEYVTTNAQPLFFSPDDKVSCTNLFELMRCRYEGSRWCPEEGGSGNVRTIGVTRQGTCHVITLDSRLPDACAGTIWVTLANAEHSVFLPVNAAVTHLDPAYAADQLKPFRYDAALASCHFRRLCALAEKDRRLIGDGVRSYWRKREAELTAEYGSVLSAAANGAVPDVRALTDYCCRQQERALADAKQILDDVLWYLAANNGTPGDGASSKPRPYSATGK